MERKLPENWPKVKLGELERKNLLCMRSGFPCGTNNESDKGIPQLRPMNIDNSGQIDLTSVKYVETDNDVTKYYVKNNDIIFNNTNSHELVGKTALWRKKTDEYVLSNHMTILRLAKDSGLEPHFLAKYFYYLWSNGYFSQIRRPYVNQAGIDLDKLRGIVIPIPPLETQRRIVAILDKAEEIRRLRAEADELAGKLPFSIFVEMFGDPMQNIEGWKMVTPTDVASDDKNAITIGPFGSDLMAKDYRSQGVPLIFVKNIRENKFRENGIRFVDESKGEELKSHRVNPGDILMTKMGDPPGDVALYPENSQPGIITADCIKLTLNPRMANASYILWVFRTDYVRNQVIRSTKGAAQQKINLSTFRSIKFPLPEIELQNQFSEKVNQVEEIRNLQARSNPQIEDLLASLMQKAFVGDLVL